MPGNFYEDNVILEEVEKMTSSSQKANESLLRAQALLYSRKKLFHQGVDLYLRLKHSDVFELIEKQQLFEEALQNISALLEIDRMRAIELFINHPKIITPKHVVTDIGDNPSLLFEYFMRLHTHSPDDCQEFENLMLKMMVQNRDSRLYQFLKESSGYDIKNAIIVCKNKGMHPELSLLYERAGDPCAALKVLVFNLENIPSSIDLCRKYNRPDMWDVLIDKCLLHSKLLQSLFTHIGIYIDPLKFLKRIPPDVCIPDLKKSLIQIMKDCSTHLELQESSLKVMVADGIDLLVRIKGESTKGYVISEQNVCIVCEESILKSKVSSSLNKSFSFRCGHSVHLLCLGGNKKNKISCIMCNASQNY